MTDGRLLYETHSHTPLCKHATGQPEDYAAVALRRGFRGLFVTCHNPMPDGFSAHVRMGMDEFDQYVDLVDRARAAWQDRVDIRLGIEADYFPGYEDWLEQQLQSADFHYVLGSVHPQIWEFRERFWDGDPTAFQRTYFNMLADAAETGLFDCLAHPDLVKNETAADWRPDQIMDTICGSLDRIATTGMAMELNTSGTRKVISEMNPCPEILAEMLKRGIPVVVGADAHEPGRVGQGYFAALDLLEAIGYREVHVFLDRRPTSIAIEAARASLSVDKNAA